MNGVTIEVYAVTSPLGKLKLPLPWNHRLGSGVWLGRDRVKMYLPACARTALTAEESTACQQVLPRTVSPPSQNPQASSPAIIVSMTASSTLWFQMPAKSDRKS